MHPRTPVLSLLLRVPDLHTASPFFGGTPRAPFRTPLPPLATRLARLSPSLPSHRRRRVYTYRNGERRGQFYWSRVTTPFTLARHAHARRLLFTRKRARCTLDARIRDRPAAPLARATQLWNSPRRNSAALHRRPDTGPSGSRERHLTRDVSTWPSCCSSCHSRTFGRLTRVHVWKTPRQGGSTNGNGSYVWTRRNEE